jgi:hypothetical protein
MERPFIPHDCGAIENMNKLINKVLVSIGSYVRKKGISSNFDQFSG